MDEVLSPCVKNGQSPMAVKAANPELFGKYAKSTLYGWIADGPFSAKKHDLPYAGTRRKPHRRPVMKTDAKCRIGRTIKEMWEFLKSFGKRVTCELDTVIGSISGKVLFTMIFTDSELALAFLRDQKTPQTCTRIFNIRKIRTCPGHGGIVPKSGGPGRGNLGKARFRRLSQISALPK